MSDNFTACLDVVLQEEGGFSDDPQDPGGATNFGVTLRTWQAWVGRPVDLNDMHALTPAIVTPLYQRQYWNADNCQALPAGLDLCVMDFAVNSGPGRAARTLQSMVGAAADGAIGPATITAVKAYVSAHGIGPTIETYMDARGAYDRSLPGYAHDGRGWDDRVRDVRAIAHQMAGGS
jgi:lysozyme family protein